MGWTRTKEFARVLERAATTVSASLGERRMQPYVSEERYWPLVGLSDWIRARSDEDSGAIADAARIHDHDSYVNRLVDIREPALAEPRSGYVFLRHGLYRPSFNWWEFAQLPHRRTFGEYTAWLVRPNRVAFLPEAVSFRNQSEKNYWHCHEEVLSKLLLVERMDLPRDIPLLVGSGLWNAPFFQDMRLARALRHRNWVLHDRPVWSKRLILCIQGPTNPENPPFVRDLFRDPERGAAGIADPARFLFVSRPRSVERHFDNDEELGDALAALGFQSIEPDRLPFWEQVERFRAAQCVVMAHGAGLGNLIHRVGSPTGLVELFPDEPELLRRSMGPWLSRESGFAYRAVVGGPMSPRGGFTVSQEAVVDAVTSVLGALGSGEAGAAGGHGVKPSHVPAAERTRTDRASRSTG